MSILNTHNNVEFGVLQKTSKQSLISIFFYIGRGDTPRGGTTVVTNAVVLVLGVSNLNTNIPGGYLPSDKVVLQCIGN